MSEHADSALTVEEAYQQDNDKNLAFLKPHFEEEKFPTVQIAGYIGSLILTFAAYFLVMNHVLPAVMLLAVILVLAGLQAALQLGVFMHLKESRGMAWQLIPLYLVFLIALGMVGMSIWIMLFKSGVS
ncbi:cytochrome o ubiquinol oxidase subunit IV [Sulfobacillus harzensis]|uniref:Cytochrome C oxidase subunit IV n=1 Tax=Sulfobacillus harzensis TaxID=2729629 RepID=A0A7Y0Q0D3_9FIRM|nr:cytochrome C oxidase subunit IV family protein [Sulfobacillus harzensis]NMP20883.1 cytochrome C oxidase subunit IV [Sulfobacillus harzensis]